MVAVHAGPETRLRCSPLSSSGRLRGPSARSTRHACASRARLILSISVTAARASGSAAREQQPDQLLGVILGPIVPDLPSNS
jgi:hypothetical protein